MLDAMTRFGAYRVDYLQKKPTGDANAFGFYLRAGILTGDSYSKAAKRQLYMGLTFIRRHLEIEHLFGIYLDVDDVENYHRPAYLQLKQDLKDGLFKRVFVLEERALLGSAQAHLDLFHCYLECGGFELFTCKNGECLQLEVASVLEPLGV